MKSNENACALTAILHYFLRSFLICLRCIPQAVILNLVFCDETARAFRLEGHVCELQLVLDAFAAIQVARTTVMMERYSAVDSLAVPAVLYEFDHDP
jgi:hypothetical protein